MFSGLDYCSEYELQVGSSCGFLTGSFSYSKFFTTTGCCLKPELQINSTSPNEISVGWDFDQNADFLIRYRIAGSEWKDTVISGCDFVLRGLNECTAATFSMMAMCQKYGNESLFSDQLNTSTDCGNCTNKTYFCIGLISYIARQVAKNKEHHQFDTDRLDAFWEDSQAFILMAAVIYVIAQIFKRGVELQNENDLTI